MDAIPTIEGAKPGEGNGVDLLESGLAGSPGAAELAIKTMDLARGIGGGLASGNCWNRACQT